jgi:biopolymer transport protein ExbD
MRILRREQEKARIEVIPMIDIVFFLLVFFMISTLSMTINRGVPVNLPTAASSQKDLRETLHITVTKDGEIFLNKAPIALQDIASQVKVGLAKDPDLLAIISADDQAFHGVIVDVMDEIRLAGVSRLAIAVQPERRAQP